MIDTTILKMVINTLEDIEVKGSNNMSNLLASIEAIGKYIKVLESIKEDKNKEEETDG